MAFAKRHHLVGIEQRRRRGAIGETEDFPDRPGPHRHLLIDHLIGSPQPRFGFLYAMGILFAVGAQSIADNLLHRLMHTQIVETVMQPRLPSAIDVRWHEPRPARIMPIE